MRRLVLLLVSVAAVAALVVASSATGVNPRAGHLYRGKTSQQDRRVRFKVTGDGARVVGFRIGRDFACRKRQNFSGRTGTFQQVSLQLNVRADGRFSGSAKVHGGRGSEIRRGRVRVRGSFSSGGSHGRGAFRERSKLRDGTRCDSGRVRFRVRAR
jgi:opacity protein-like surface antigen